MNMPYNIGNAAQTDEAVRNIMGVGQAQAAAKAQTTADNAKKIADKLTSALYGTNTLFPASSMSITHYSYNSK